MTAAFADRLLEWFDRHGRHDLPWQHPRTPYRVWVSEIMLQQTQVATVIPYFERFLARFPALEDLAAADVDEVLSLWTGLGYYARARNLHRAAMAMAEEGVPETVEGWNALPGVGPSTAAAIVAQAFDRRAVILDGNVKRVLARHAAVDTPQESAATAHRLWALADQRTPPGRAADYTQAIMDLGATVCRRGTPRCEACPVREDCRARIEGRAAELPVRRRRKQRPVRERVLLWLEDSDGRLFLEKRPPSGIWGGLACLPVNDDAGSVDDRLAELGLQRDGDWQALGRLRHVFSHFELSAEVLATSVAPVSVADRPGEWLVVDQLVSDPPVGLPAPIQRVIREQHRVRLDRP
ncbi:A/G-specific adenine glycosylase [Guyparkeria sp.]|uniref:A/G-specific adenine glycosylase n=1 Tax=Guyparkeria sp. TaxID=2035736 RepID=UPI00397108D9